MKRLTTSVLAIGIAGAAFASQHTTMEGGEPGAASGMLAPSATQNFMRAENIIGADIYTLSTEYDEDEWMGTEYYDEIDTEWEEVGEVEDIVMSRDGQLIGLVAEVGGFLDIGDSDILLNLDDVRTVGGGVDVGYDEISFVTRLSEEQLEGMQDVDETLYGE